MKNQKMNWGKFEAVVKIKNKILISTVAIEYIYLVHQESDNFPV